MLKGCVQNLKREYADLVVGMAVFIEQISQSALQCNMCSIDARYKGHSLYDAYDFITGEQAGYDWETTREEQEKFTAYMQEQYPHTRTTVDEMFEVGDDKVVYITTTTSTHKSGKEVTTKGMSLDRIADGKIVESWYSWDRLGYWQQLGFVPHVKDLLAQFEKQ